MVSHRAKPITAVFRQEHNVKVADKPRLISMARDHELILILAPCPDNVPKGGTAIIIPRTALEIPPKSNFSATLKKIENSIRVLRSGRAVAANMMVEGKKTRLVSAYAHADGQAASRPNFFSTTLASLLNKETIMGIDANCVPNEALDLNRVGQPPLQQHRGYRASP
eukprot:5538484-Prymnesium_polylepis.1